MNLTPLPPAELAARRAAIHAAIKAETLDLGAGITLAPDRTKKRSGRGAGWCLAIPKEPDRYFATPDKAREWLAGRAS